MSAFTEAEFFRTGAKRKCRDLWKVFGLAFDLGYKDSGLTIRVPDGFETDGPSVPHWLLRFLPVKKMIKSSALHDYLRERLSFSKFYGDRIFLEALKVEGCPLVWRWLAFLAVLTNFSRKRAV